MRLVDMETHHVVKTGIAWPWRDQPNCKKMIGQLERNESLITWLVPKNGDIKDQIPAIRVKDNFYTMSLRMMKVSVIPKYAFCILQNNRCFVHVLTIVVRPYGGLKPHTQPLLFFRNISNLNHRHVRLKKNFVNRETIPHVGVKLRIPEVLLVEKMRTQQRFNVSINPLDYEHKFYI